MNVDRHAPRVGTSPCPVKVAMRFNAEVHRKLPAIQGGMWAVAAVIADKTIGVAIVGHPQARLTSQRIAELEILRVAVIEGSRNACSALYGACARAARAMGAADLTTTIHIDEPGGSLIAAGWVRIGETDGGEWSRPSRARNPAKDARPKVRWAVPWGRSAAAKSWNWCRWCKQLVDADDVHDGSEVKCIGCGRWFVVVTYQDGTASLESVRTRKAARKETP